MSDQPVLRMGEMRALLGKSDDLHAFIYRVIVPSLQTAEGCQGVDVWKDASDPLRYLIVEYWDSVEAHRASVKEIDPEDIKVIMDLLDDSPRGNYYVPLE